MIVAFINNSALALNKVERDDSGSIKKAWVVNGQWTLVIKNGECQAKRGNYIVNRWPIETIEEVEVKDTGNYNSIIAAAQLKRKPVQP